MLDTVDLETISPPVKKTGPFHCNFCGKSNREAKRMISGPNVFICDECTELCVDIIREDVPDFASEASQFDPKKAVFILDGQVVGYITDAIIRIGETFPRPLVSMRANGVTLKGWLTKKHGHTFELSSTSEEAECPTSTSTFPNGSSPSSSALSPSQDGAQ
jgi:hypothetical protein